MGVGGGVGVAGEREQLTRESSAGTIITDKSFHAKMSLNSS